jgi:hypothetical protein
MARWVPAAKPALERSADSSLPSWRETYAEVTKLS